MNRLSISRILMLSRTLKNKLWLFGTARLRLKISTSNWLSTILTLCSVWDSKLCSFGKSLVRTANRLIKLAVRIRQIVSLDVYSTQCSGIADLVLQLSQRCLCLNHKSLSKGTRTLILCQRLKPTIFLHSRSRNYFGVLLHYRRRLPCNCLNNLQLNS